MAERRMIAKGFVNSDGFSDLPKDARLLYFYLNLNADDDGFIGQAKRIARTEGIDEKCIEVLLESGFLLYFPDNNVYLLRHWNVNNCIQNDRYHSTNYQAEYSKVEINSNKVYMKKSMDTECIQDVYKMDTQYSPVQSNQSSPVQSNQSSAGEEEGSPKGGGEPSRKQVFTELQGYGLTDADINRLLNDCGCGLVHERLFSWKGEGRLSDWLRGQ